MPRLIELSGQVFGYLTVLSRVSATGQARWLCACKCGKKTIVPGYDLRTGIIKSCGCLRIEIVKKRSITHGKTKTIEYYAWINMRNRCYYKKNKTFNRYGALGITVCDQWRHSFETFLTDMGPRPFGYSLDRIDPRGNYCPENCRWTTLEIQQTNKKCTKFAILNGETKPISIWCRILGISYRTIRARIAAGWEPEKALLTPIKLINKTY